MKSKKSKWIPLANEYINDNLSGETLRQFEQQLAIDFGLAEEVNFLRRCKAAIQYQKFLKNNQFINHIFRKNKS